MREVGFCRSVNELDSPIAGVRSVSHARSSASVCVGALAAWLVLGAAWAQDNPPAAPQDNPTAVPQDNTAATQDKGADSAAAPASESPAEHPPEALLPRSLNNNPMPRPPQLER